jgi:AcrR family transcriptional regulator
MFRPQARKVEAVDQPLVPLVPLGQPRAERADATRNRLHLLAVAREMLAEQSADSLTMDGLAERAGLGKGTVFRRFGSRAGIFRALLDDEEHAFQERVLYGPPPLGPGAPALDRLVAYGRARTDFLISNRAVARAGLDGGERVPAGRQTPLSQLHIRMLLRQLGLGAIDLDLLAIQLTAALDAPLLIYLTDDFADVGRALGERLGQSWQDLVQRVCRPG